MIKKGVISNKIEGYAEAYLPDENDTVTAMLPFAASINADEVQIGDKCAIAFFDADNVNFADGVIIAILTNKRNNAVPTVGEWIEGEITEQTDEQRTHSVKVTESGVYEYFCYAIDHGTNGTSHSGVVVYDKSILSEVYEVSNEVNIGLTKLDEVMTPSAFSIFVHTTPELDGFVVDVHLKIRKIREI